MSALETELELESLEFESLGEAEAEQEAFFNHLAAMADRGGRSQALRRVAMAAARQALRGARRPWPVIEGEFGLEGEGEGEFELEGSFELEALLNPAQRGAALAMMEHMAHEAAHAEHEQEAAEQFLPLIPLAAKALLPLAAKALPIAGKVGGKLLAKAAPRLLGRVVPNLTRGVSQLARGLFRNRATRPLLRAVPTIARRTVGRLASQALRGRRITPVGAARTLARQTLRTLRSPRDLSRSYRRARRADRRYHWRARRYTGAPAGGGARAGSARRSAGFAGGAAAAQAAGNVTPVAPLTPITPVVPMAMGVPAGAALAPCQCFRSVPCANCGA
jgi:hypothetical protein